MMPRGGFEDFINHFTLRFSNAEIEERFWKGQEEKVQGFGRSKIIILTAAVVMNLTMAYTAYRHYSKNELESFWAITWAFIVGDTCLALEFITHYVQCCRCIRCVFLACGFYFIAVYYSSHVLQVPAMLPG